MKASDVYAINRLAGFEGGNLTPLIFIGMLVSRMVFIICYLGPNKGSASQGWSAMPRTQWERVATSCEHAVPDSKYYCENQEDNVFRMTFHSHKNRYYT